MMTGVECGHIYCTSCWTEYLATKIMDEGASQSIECPSSSCDILVDDQTVMRLVKDSKIKLKYQHLITNSFVQVNSRSVEISWFFQSLRFCVKSILEILEVLNRPF